MRYTIAAYQMREVFTMIAQQLLAVFWMFASQQGAAGFFLAPDHIHRIRKEGISGAFSSKSSRNKSGLSSLKDEETDDDQEIRENDLSMFIKTEEEEKNGDAGFDPLEFFMTMDDSIEKLEEVENFFREEPMGIMMEEKERTVGKEHIATTNPVASDKIKMTKNSETIGIDEVPQSKKVMYYDYDGSLTKIKGNLCDSPVIFYSE